MNQILSYFCKIFLKPIVERLFIKEIKGWENIPKGNFILAANHQSHLDQILTGFICVPKKFTYIGQIDRYSGFGKFLLYLLYFIAGVIHVDRKDKVSRKDATEKAIEALKNGYTLVIYPEGTRTRTGKIQEGRLGVAKIFVKTKVPILPVGIVGAFKLMPPGKAFPKIKRTIKINIGKPLFFKEELEKIKGIEKNSPKYEEVLRKITEKTMKEITILAEESDQNFLPDFKTKNIRSKAVTLDKIVKVIKR